jgi:hypothetical protein
MIKGEGDIDVQRLQLGQEIHKTEMAIHASRLAIGELRAQEPVDEAAISSQRLVMRAAHHRRHELQHPLETVKKAAEMTPDRRYRVW